MKSETLVKRNIKLLTRIGAGISLIFFSVACAPLVYDFDSTEDAVSYQAQKISDLPSAADTLTIMTWNIRFGAGRLPWFGDACGGRVILTENEVKSNLQRIAEKINEIQPDILFLQEVKHNLLCFA